MFARCSRAINQVGRTISSKGAEPMGSIWIFTYIRHLRHLKSAQLMMLVPLMMSVITLPSPVNGQERVRVVRPVGPLDPYDPVRFPALGRIRPHFEWSMKDRFGLDANQDGLIDFTGNADSSRCYLQPESGPPCPTHPWIVTFDGTGSSGRSPLSFDWIISGDVQCDGHAEIPLGDSDPFTDSPIITCSFATH